MKPSPQYQVIPVQPIEPELVKFEEPPKSESPLLYSKITPPKIKPFNISLKDTDGNLVIDFLSFKLVCQACQGQVCYKVSPKNYAASFQMMIGLETIAIRPFPFIKIKK